MEHRSPQADQPKLIQPGDFSLDRLLSHVDPGPAKESEAFVQAIYERRHGDATLDPPASAGR